MTVGLCHQLLRAATPPRTQVGIDVAAEALGRVDLLAQRQAVDVGVNVRAALAGLSQRVEAGVEHGLVAVAGPHLHELRPVVEHELGGLVGGPVDEAGLRVAVGRGWS